MKAQLASPLADPAAFGVNANRWHPPYGGSAGASAEGNMGTDAP